MKKTIVALAVLAALVSLSSDAQARRRGGFGGSPGASTFGAGLIFITPDIGLSLEVRLSARSAIDVAIDFDVFDDDESSISHIDYLVYLADLSRSGAISVPLYLGIGAVLWERPYDDDDLNFGLRVPFGIALALRQAPVQFFFEAAVRVLFYDDNDADDDDDADVDLTGGLGFRVYF